MLPAAISGTGAYLLRLRYSASIEQRNLALWSRLQLLGTDMRDCSSHLAGDGLRGVDVGPAPLLGGWWGWRLCRWRSWRLHRGSLQTTSTTDHYCVL